MIDKSVPSQFSSIKLDQLVYVELEARNGGMMLTVSEEGFTFRAVTSVRPSGRIPFSFVINGTQKLEGFGEIKWTKDEGKVAGLQFIDVSTEFLNALRKWLNQLSAPVVPSSAEALNDNSINLDHGLRTESPQPAPPQPMTETQPRSAFGMNFGQSLGSATRQFEVAQASALDTSTAPLPRSTHILTDWEYPDGLPAQPSSRGNGVVVAAGVACLLLLAVLLYSFRETIGRSLISLGQTLSSPSSSPSENSQAQVPDPSKPEEEVRQPATTNAAKQDNAASSNADQTSPSQSAASNNDKPDAVRPQEHREKIAPPPPKTENQFRDERPAPSSEEPVAATTRNLSPAEEVRALWSAVGQGNTAAEVTLAKLYMIGGGVPKNCDQARVLLRAAAKKGNSEAIGKLSLITRQGCP
jgi:TPR repeat protein